MGGHSHHGREGVVVCAPGFYFRQWTVRVFAERGKPSVYVSARDAQIAPYTPRQRP